MNKNTNNDKGKKTDSFDCLYCEHFDGEDCTIIIDESDYEKCLRPTEDGLGYEFCPLYGGYPKEGDDG